MKLTLEQPQMLEIMTKIHEHGCRQKCKQEKQSSNIKLRKTLTSMAETTKQDSWHLISRQEHQESAYLCKGPTRLILLEGNDKLDPDHICGQSQDVSTGKYLKIKVLTTIKGQHCHICNVFFR